MHTGASGLYCIGFLEDESTGITYLFFTNYQDKDPNQITYAPNSSNYIISFNTINSELITLVQGAFLNFSKTMILPSFKCHTILKYLAGSWRVLLDLDVS